MRKNVSQRQIFRLPIINCNDHHNSTLRPVDKIHTVIWFSKQILNLCSTYSYILYLNVYEKYKDWYTCRLNNFLIENVLTAQKPCSREVLKRLKNNLKCNMEPAQLQFGQFLKLAVSSFLLTSSLCEAKFLRVYKKAGKMKKKNSR